MIKIILILLFSIPIFQYGVYWLLVDAIDVGFAYSIDQLLPLILTSILAFVVAKKYVPISVVKKYVYDNGVPFLIIIVSVLVVHGLVLGNYFMEEEPHMILSFVNDDGKTSLVDGILRGYQHGIYILSYQLFFTKAILYNVVALTLYILTTIILYIFLNQLFNKKVIPALVGTLFFVTTPAYMDMFFWQANFSGMPIALSAGILSLIFLSAHQKNNKISYYFLSLLFYLSMLKIGFVRLHAFTALPLFMCLIPLSARFSRPDMKRFVLSVLPFLGIFLSYILVVFILPDHLFERGVTVRGAPLNTDGYFGVLSMFVAYLFIPSETASLYYPKIKEFLVPSGMSLTLPLGAFCIGVLVITGLIALRNIRQSWGRLMIFAIITIFANLVLTPLFIQGYNIPSEMDQRFSNTGAGNGPGLRYVFVSAMGLSMLIATITYWVVTNKKKYMGAFLTVIFLLFVYYSYLNIGSHISALKSIHPAKSAVPDHVFSMVPKDGKKKLLYSVNPEYNAIDAKIGDWLHAFYKLDELKYTKSLEDVQKMIASGVYEKNNFYAFYNNTLTQTFMDVSELARSEFFDSKIDQKITLIQSANLTTSFTETKNSSFPFVLSRGIYVSQDLSQRLLSPRKLSFSIQKKWLPVRYPYVDGYEPKEKHMDPFPLSLWDTLTNKPLIISLKSLGMDLKVNKHYIDSQEILNTFQDSPSLNSLALLYVCAEDIDWEKQKKSSETVGGIWYVKEFPLNSNQVTEEISTPFTCFGSILRKIILVGLPVPSAIAIQEISLQKD